MEIEKNYMINQDFMCMVGIYDRNAKLCTIVREIKRTFIVDMSPLEILDYSIKEIGYSYKSARDAAKEHLGDSNMCPVMVNLIWNICLFPNHSPKRDDTMWFNPEHIDRTYSSCLKTMVEFQNGLAIKVHSKLASFNTKLKTAEQYQKAKMAAATNPKTFLLDPKNRKKRIHR